MNIIERMKLERKRRQVADLLQARLQALKDSHPVLYEDLANKWMNGEFKDVTELVDYLVNIEKGWLA